MCLVAKFNCTATFVIIYMQSVELYPTPLRNIGMGFNSFIANILGIPGPHFIYLGTINKAIPYLGLGLICLTGGIAASFLPETKGASLPETAEEAANFGRDQKYFAFKVSPQQESREQNTV